MSCQAPPIFLARYLQWCVRGTTLRGGLTKDCNRLVLATIQVSAGYAQIGSHHVVQTGFQLLLSFLHLANSWSLALLVMHIGQLGDIC